MSRASSVRMEALGLSLGSQRRPLEEAARRGELRSSTEALSRAGFVEHHCCDDEQSVLDLALAAVEQLPSVEGVGLIVFATGFPASGALVSRERFEASGDVRHLLVSPAARLQAELGLSQAEVLGLSQLACTTSLAALEVGRRALLERPDFERVLCVTADRLPEGALREQSFNLISDGAAACLLSRDTSGPRLLASGGRCLGVLADAGDEVLAASYFSHGRELVLETLGRAGLGLEQLDDLVLQNVPVAAQHVLASVLGLPPERVHCPTRAEVGHVISVDNFFNWRALTTSELREEDQQDRNVALLSVGYGQNWQCQVLGEAA
ncbi:MAG: hypothetical protein AAF533_08725 [Acidobacteriota bacterium]